MKVNRPCPSKFPAIQGDWAVNRHRDEYNVFDEACKSCCIQTERYRAKNRALRNAQVQGRFWWFLVVYEEVLLPARKVRSKPVQGCTTNAEVTVRGETEECHDVLCPRLQTGPKAADEKFCYHRKKWENRWVCGEQSLWCVHAGNQIILCADR